MKKYDRITVEISGICNAKCVWCYTGRKNRYKKCIEKRNNVFMSAEDFEAGLNRLISKNILSANAEIELYNWGEPLLNPEFDDILAVIEKYDMPFHISTNCSQVKNFTGKHIKNMTLFMVSLSGFSQQTYGKIHGLNFEEVLNNIDKVAKVLNSNNLLHIMEINFHVYKFNLHEISKAKEYFESRGIRFVPRIAYFNDYYLFDRFLCDSLPKRLKSTSENHLMVDLLLQEAKRSPQNYICPQRNKIVVDEQWNLVPCCRLSSDEKLGNILDLNLEEIALLKQQIPYCKSCICTGQSYIVHQELKFQYGIIGKIDNINLMPKLLIDYSGKGFYWFCTMLGDKIQRSGNYSSAFKFPAPPKALRFQIPCVLDNIIISDFKAESEGTSFKTFPLSNEEKEFGIVFQKRQAVFDIILNDNLINEIKISFSVSFLSDNHLSTFSDFCK